MHDTSDTIIAVSSPDQTPGQTIIRLSGPETFSSLKNIFQNVSVKHNTISQTKVCIEDELELEAKIYSFYAPYSYTGDDLAEIHITANHCVIESLLEKFLDRHVRFAGPGEFTARAYLNGKLDLPQAEAVAKIVAGSNQLQLAAAQKLLAGRLSENLEKITSEMLDIITLIEAGMDFSEEDIEFVTKKQAVEAVTGIKQKLEKLLNTTIQQEVTIEMPAVGISGRPNVGKSSLLNATLGQQRSIVSSRTATTRDVLTGLLELKNSKCVLFDCAGFLRHQNGIIDALAQQAAAKAVNSANLVIFCLESVNQDYAEEIEILKTINQQKIIPVVTKTDLLDKKQVSARGAELKKIFGWDFIFTSAENNEGIEKLKSKIDKMITASTADSVESSEKIAITKLHEQAVNTAIENLSQAVLQLQSRSDETAAMLLRNSYQALTSIEHQTLDEAVLEKIFSQFCIGK